MKPPAEFKVMRVRDCGTPADIVDTPDRVFDYWKANVATAPWFDPAKEAFVVLILNTRRRILGHNLVALGGLDNVAGRPASDRPTLADILHLDYDKGGEMVYSWSYTVHRFLNETGRGASWLAMARALRNPDQQQAMSAFEAELDALIANDSVASAHKTALLATKAELERAKAALAGSEATAAAPQQPTSADRAPAAPTTPTASEGAPMIPIPGLLIGLASSLIQAFAPLAREKVEREIARHTDNPAVAEQVASAVIDAAKAATGQADPIAAVAAVKADPAAQAAVQESTLDHLELMAPVLDRLAAMDAAEWSAEESSRTAAAARAAAERNDPAMLLTYASLGIVILLIVFVGAVAAVQIIKAGKADTEVWAALTGLIGWATAKSGSIYDYRFGTSRSSSAKDVIIGELSSRGRAQQ